MYHTHTPYIAESVLTYTITINYVYICIYICLIKLFSVSKLTYRNAIK